MSLDDKGFVKFHVTHKNEPITVSAEDIGGYIVRQLVDTMKKNFTSTAAPKLAVVSVPAEFDQLQRNATSKALNKAGESVIPGVGIVSIAVVTFYACS